MRTDAGTRRLSQVGDRPIRAFLHLGELRKKVKVRVTGKQDQGTDGFAEKVTKNFRPKGKSNRSTQACSRLESFETRLHLGP